MLVFTLLYCLTVLSITGGSREYLRLLQPYRGCRLHNQRNLSRQDRWSERVSRFLIDHTIILIFFYHVEVALEISVWRIRRHAVGMLYDITAAWHHLILSYHLIDFIVVTPGWSERFRPVKVIALHLLLMNVLLLLDVFHELHVIVLGILRCWAPRCHFMLDPLCALAHHLACAQYRLLLLGDIPVDLDIALPAILFCDDVTQGRVDLRCRWLNGTTDKGPGMLGFEQRGRP